MKINLDDNKLHLRFAPLTLTRPLGNLRMGILCNNERWKMYIPEAEELVKFLDIGSRPAAMR